MFHIVRKSSVSPQVKATALRVGRGIITGMEITTAVMENQPIITEVRTWNPPILQIEDYPIIKRGLSYINKKKCII
jgi:hypothetical protein